MLTPYSRSQFIEKVMTDVNGRQFRVLFLVSLGADGEVKGRIISAEPLAENVLALPGAVADATLCLPCVRSAQDVETPYFASPAPFVSPYFDIELLLTAQPTRAPSRA